MSPASADPVRSSARIATYRPTALPLAITLLFLVFFARSAHTAPSVPKVMAQPSQTTASVTITVTTTEDELNQDGDCSLREAVQAANTNVAVDACPAGGGEDTILLSAGTYSLTLSDLKDDSPETGDLDLLGPVRIIGQGQRATIIHGNGIDRGLEIHEGSSVFLAHFTVTGGHPPRREDGGGILNRGTLVAEDLGLRENQAGSGVRSAPKGGSGGGLANPGTATLRAVWLYDNQAGSGFNDRAPYPAPYPMPYSGPNSGPSSRSTNTDAGDGGDGGAISNNGTLVIQDSLVESNGTGSGGCWAIGHYSGCEDRGNGGGILNYSALTMTRTTIVNNHGKTGGGLLNWGSGSIEQSLISQNYTYKGNSGIYIVSSGGDGGGVLNFGDLTIKLTAIDSNHAGDAGSGAYSQGETGGKGGGIYNNGNVTLDRCLIIGNSSGNGAVDDWEYQGNGTSDGGDGGGIYSHGILTITQSTISGNVTGDGGYSENEWIDVSGAGGFGGGIYANNAHVSFTTFSANSTGTGTNGASDGQGGGIYSAGVITLTGVLFSANVAPGDGPNCAGSAITSLGYNLIEASQGCTITGTLAHTSTDILDQPALLGPLADNGGPTWTHEPMAASPVVDAVPASACVDIEGALLSTDQRGVFRPQGAACDMGSVERIMSAVAGPDTDAHLRFVGGEGLVVDVDIPAGAYSLPTEIVFRPIANDLPPGFHWAATRVAFDLLAIPQNPALSADSRSNLGASLPIHIQIQHDERIFADTPIIREGGLRLLHRQETEPWQWDSAEGGCSGRNMAVPISAPGEIDLFVCHTGHFLIAGPTHSTAMPLFFAQDFSRNGQ